MRKKTKITIISSIALVLGLAGTGVGYIFLRHQEGEASAGSIDDPTLQQKYLEREGNSSVNDYISSGNIKDILFVTNNELKNAKYWKSTAEGGVTSVGQFQPVKNERIINYVDDKYGREVFFSSMTYSMFNKTAEIRYTNNTTYLMWRGDIKSMDEANYDASTILEMKSQRPEDVLEENPDVYYFDRYGQLQDGLSNYILNDYTVVDGKYLPEESGDGKYTFYYELCTTNLLDETDNSTYLTRNTAELYKREVKTMSGNDGFPPFNYANLQITIDDNFRILSSVANDGYSINKPLSTSVDSKLSYTFTYFDSYQDVPYYDDLQKHFDTAQNADGGSFGDEDSALNYLAQAGNNLISQDRININIYLFDESNRLPLNLSFKPNMNNLLNSNLDLLIGDYKNSNIYLNYSSNGCYFKFGDTEFNVSVSEMMNVLTTFVPLEDLIGLLGSASGDIDISSINGLDTLLNKAELDKNEQTKEMTITLYLEDLLASDSFPGLSGTAYIGIQNYDTEPVFTYIKSDDLSFGIEGFNNIPVSIYFLENRQSVFPQVNSKAPKLTNLSKYAKAIKNMIENKQFAGTLQFENTINNMFINVNGSYKLKIDANNSFNFSTDLYIKLNELQLNVNLLYMNNKFYVSLNDSLKVALTFEEIQMLVSQLNLNDLLEMFGIDLSLMDQIKLNVIQSEVLSNLTSIFQDLNIQKVLNMLDSVVKPLQVDDNSMSLVLDVKGYDFKVTFNTDGKLSLESEKLNLSLVNNIATDLTFDDVNDSEYVQYDKLHTLVTILNDFIETKKVAFDVNTSFNINNIGTIQFVGNVSFDFSTNFEFDIKGNIYLNNKIYTLSVVKNNEKILLKLNDISTLTNTEEILNILSRIDETFNLNLNLDNAKLNELLTSLNDGSSFTDIVEKLTQFISVFNQSTKSVDLNNMNIFDILSNIKLVNNRIVVDIDSIGNFEIYTGDSVNVSKIITSDKTITNLSSYLDAIINIYQNKAMSGQIALNTKIDDLLLKVNGEYKVSLNENLNVNFDSNLNIDINDTRINVNVQIINDRVYLVVDNKLKLNLSFTEAQTLFETFKLQDLLQLLNIDSSNISSSLNLSNITLLDDIKQLMNNFNFDNLFSLTDKLIGDIEVFNNALAINLNVENYDVRVMFNTSGYLQITSEKLGLLIDSQVCESFVLPSVDTSTYYDYDDLNNLVQFANRLIETKKLSLDLNAEVDIPNLGLSSFDGIVVFDFNNNVDFDLKGNFENANFKVNLSIVKNKERIFINLGNVSFVLHIDELPLLIENIESMFNVSLNINYSELSNLLTKLSDGSNMIDVINQIVSFANNFNKPNTLSGENQTVSTILDILCNNLKLTEDSISLTLPDIGDVTLRSDALLNVSTIITNENTLTYDELKMLFDKVNVVLDYITNKETFHFTLNLSQYSYVDQAKNVTMSIENATIDLQLPKDKTSITRDLVKFKVSLTLNINQAQHTIDATYDGSYLYVSYNNAVKGMISIDEGLKVVKYLVEILKINNPIVNLLISGVEEGIDSSIFDDYIKPDTGTTTQYDINDIIRKLYVDEQSLVVSLSTKQLLNIDNVIDINLGIDSEKVNSITVNNATLGDNSYIDASVFFDMDSFNAIVAPSDAASYMDLSTFELLLRSFFNSAYTMNFDITGTLHLDFISIFTSDSPFRIQVKLDEQFRPVVHLEVDFDGVLGFIGDGYFDLWYKFPLYENDPTGHILYMSRQYVYSSWFQTKKDYYYRTLDLNTNTLYDANGGVINEADMVTDLVLFVLNPTNEISKSILRSSINSEVEINQNPNIANMNINYVADNNLNKYTLSADFSEVISLIGQTSVSLYCSNLQAANSDKVDSYISGLDLSMNAISVANLTVNGVLNNIGQTIELELPSDIGFNSWNHR